MADTLIEDDEDEGGSLLSEEEQALIAGKEIEDEPAEDDEAETRLIPLDELDEDGDPLLDEEDDETKPEAEEQTGDEGEDAGEEAKAEPDAVDPAPLRAAMESAAAALAKLPKVTDEEAARREAIVAEKKALLKSFDDGDMTAADYDKARDDLEKEDREIERKLDRWNAGLEAYQEAESASWNADVGAWFDKHADVLAAAQADAQVMEAFNKIVMRIEGDPELSAGLNCNQILDQALTTFKARYPKVEFKAPAAPAKAAEKPSKKEEHPADRVRREKAAKPTPTLAHMPAAASSEAGEGEFASLDLLSERDPEAYEEGLTKLYARDPAAYERYMKAS